MADSAEYFNGQVSTINIADSLHKFVNDCFIDYLRFKMLNGRQITDLREIAVLCPFEFGDGVYIVRALLVQADTLDASYVNACEHVIDSDNKTMEHQSSPENGEISVSLFPNPTNGSLNIQILCENEGLCLFEIYDLMGKKILKNSIQMNETETIDVSSLQQGVYYYIITHMDKVIQNDKLVIIK